MVTKRGCESCGNVVTRERHHAGQNPDGGWSTWLCLPCVRKGEAAYQRRRKQKARDLVRQRLCIHCGSVVDNRTARKAGPMVGDRWIHADCVPQRQAQLAEIAEANARMNRVVRKMFASIG